MKAERYIKESFAVIGKEGSTASGPGFIKSLWVDASAHFNEIQHLAKKDNTGNLAGIWGAMTDFSRAFMPWEDGFSKGLYLAGIECNHHAEPPAGWTKWIIPGYEYVVIPCESENTFVQGLEYLTANDLCLAGAVHDFTHPATGKNYMFFPIRKL